MNLRLSSKAQRAVIVAASFAAAFTLSCFSIRNALAVHYAGEQTPEAYQRAARLEPAAPRNWYLWDDLALVPEPGEHPEL